MNRAHFLVGKKRHAVSTSLALQLHKFPKQSLARPVMEENYKIL